MKIKFKIKKPIIEGIPNITPPVQVYQLIGICTFVYLLVRFMSIISATPIIELKIRVLSGFFEHKANTNINSAEIIINII
jgi:hypothetical protein